MQQLALPVSLPLCLPYLPTPTGALDRIEDADDAGTLAAEIDTLVAEGWEFHGTSSCYCVVLLSPDGDRVLKLGNGAGAEATIRAALALPDNPHLPRVYGFKRLLNSDWEFAAEMEALEHLQDMDDDDDGDNCDSFEDWRSSVSWKGGDRYKGPDLATMSDGPLKDAFAALVAEGPGCSWDVHDRNVMVRPSDGAIVLNDLLA